MVKVTKKTGIRPQSATGVYQVSEQFNTELESGSSEAEDTRSIHTLSCLKLRLVIGDVGWHHDEA